MLWRGGKRPKEEPANKPAQPQTNGVGKGKEVEVIVIDSDDNEPQKEELDAPDDEFEEREDEQDPDCPYPSVIQDLDMDLGSEVLHLAVPSVATLGNPQAPQLSKSHIALALSCSDGRTLLMTLPLSPPKSSKKQEFFENQVIEMRLEGASGIASDLTVKVLVKDEQPLRVQHTTNEDEDSDGQILVASVSLALTIWRISTNPGSIVQTPESAQPILNTVVSASSVLFNNSPRSSQLLLADRSGAVRIYDLSSARTAARPSSRDSTSAATPGEETGRWLMAYHTPFHSPKDGQALARRKKILDAAWVLGGRAIFALLEDGEWGIWDFSGAIQSNKNVEGFAIHGFLSQSSAGDVADTSKQKRGASKLAPMTPNTRKAKAEGLFAETPRAPTLAPAGGISISTSVNRSGQAEESVMLWHGIDIYSINSMQTFWQRSTTNTSGGFGSLYTPGLTHLSDVNLMNENITSILQFASRSTTSALGQMNTTRDVLVSAEHRFIILQNLRPSVAANNFSQQAAERPTSRDQQMLDAGELDLGGMDRMLDSMAGDGRARRVGFAH